MHNYLTSSQAAKMIGVSHSTIKRMCDSQELSTVRTLGGHRRIPIAQVQNWLQQQVQCSPEELCLANHEARLNEDSLVAWLLADRMELAEGELLRRLATGSDFVTLVDHWLAPAMWEIGQLWAQGGLDVFEEHLCSERLMKLLHRLPALLTTYRKRIAATHEGLPWEPVGVGCATGQESHAIASKLVEISLMLQGWRGISLGEQVPVSSLIAASRKFQATVIWCSYSVISDPIRCYQENQELYHSLDSGQFLVVGGKVLDDQHLSRMDYHFCCTAMSDLPAVLTAIEGKVLKTTDQPSAC